MTTIINAQNNQAQDLFNITYPTPRVPSLTSVGAEAVLTFDTTNVNVNTQADVDGATGQITLSSTSTVYQITAQAEINSNIPVTLKLVRSATGEQVGVAVPIQKQLAVVLQPATAGDYEIVAFTDSTQNFQYPNQIKNAQITVQDFVSGGGGNPFDQDLNTTSSVQFAAINVLNTSTISSLYNSQLSWDTTNPPVAGGSSLSSYPGATKFASTLSGAGITIETFRTSTGFQRWHFSRAGSLVFPGGSSYFSSSLGSSLTGPSNAPVSISDGNIQSLIELTTSTGMKLWTDWQTAVVPTIDVQTSAVSLNAPLTATTATITYINVGTAAQLRSQSSNFPFGLNTATILTVDSAVYNSGRLHVSVGGSLGLSSEAEHIQIDFITNGVTVVSTTSNLLTTTSPSLCSYAVSMSGTDVIVEATNLDPLNFLPTEVNVMAELVANSIS